MSTPAEATTRYAAALPTPAYTGPGDLSREGVTPRHRVWRTVGPPAAAFVLGTAFGVAAALSAVRTISRHWP